MSQHDPLRQLKYLRQTLSQDKKPLGFLLAAGCPLAVKVPEEKWPLIPDVARLTKFVSDELKSKDENKNNYDKLLAELIKAGNTKPNIEEILSFIRGLKQVSLGATDIRGFTEDDLSKLEKDVCQKIAEKVNVFLPDRRTPYHQLAQWIHLIERETPIEVFTTNYDLLMEQAFEETRVAYFDGFVGARFPFFDLRAVEDSLIPKHWTRLWKVHGSINWFQKPDQDVYRSTNVNESDSYIIHPSHLKYDQSRKMPYLALIDRLNSFLRQKSAVLITIGYSFGDTHLNDTIINALKANPTAMVIALLHDTYTFKNSDNELVNRYERAFAYAENSLNLSAWSFDEAVIGGVRGKWMVNNAETLVDENVGNAIEKIPEIIQKDDGSEETINHYQLKLGDFSVLGNFIQELIGIDQFKTEDA
jgi:SIR2-like domain